MGRLKWVGCGGWLLLSVVVATAGCGGADTSPMPSNAGARASAGTAAAEAGARTSGGQPPNGSGGASPESGGGQSGSAGNGGDASLAEAGTDGVQSMNFYAEQVRGREGCLPRPLPVVEADADGFEAGQVRCQIELVMALAANASCSCNAADHLRPASGSLRAVITTNLRQSGACGTADGVDCQNPCICELEQSRGEALSQCQNETTPIAQLEPGFCYVDVNIDPPLGNPALVASCPEAARRGLRILGPAPQPEPLSFIACSSN